MTLSRFDRDRRRPSTSTSRRVERGTGRSLPPVGLGQSSGMDPNSLVLQYLSEAHATETALVTNLKAHIAMTSDGSYKRVLERHLDETRAQVTNIDRRRGELGSDDDGNGGGKGLVAGAVGL